MAKEIIATLNAPGAIGPYSQAVKVDGWVYVSGQIPLDPQSGELVDADVAQATRRVLENVKAVLAAAGGTLEQVVKTTVYLSDMNDFAAMNAVYGEYFTERPPARACVEVARLPKDVRVEVDAIARVP